MKFIQSDHTPISINPKDIEYFYQDGHYCILARKNGDMIRILESAEKVQKMILKEKKRK